MIIIKSLSKEGRYEHANFGYHNFTFMHIPITILRIKKRKTVSLLEHYLQSGEFGDYLTLLDSTFVTLVFPKFNRLYMRLNAYLFMDDEKNALKLLDIMLEMKVSKKQRVDLIVKLSIFTLSKINMIRQKNFWMKLRHLIKIFI